jgi:hypothetical protein
VWRHVLFIVIDTSLAALASSAPDRLWLPAAILFVQQAATHGRAAWLLWRFEHEVAWIDALVVAFMLLSTLVAVEFRWNRAGDRSATDAVAAA